MLSEIETVSIGESAPRGNQMSAYCLNRRKFINAVAVTGGAALLGLDPNFAVAEPQLEATRKHMDPPVVVMLGDSITAQMATNAASLPFPFRAATYLGVSGNTAAQIAARIRYVPSNSTHVVIEGGTNDMVGNDQTSRIVPAYTSMLNSISPTKTVILAGVPQVDESLLAPDDLAVIYNSRIARVNADLVSLCVSYSNVIPAVDAMNLSMSGKTLDGIHLTLAGQRAYLTEVAKYVVYATH